MPAISTKGQVTVPKKIRDRFGLKPGQLVEFKVSRGQVVLLKASNSIRMRKWVGAIKLEQPVDEFVRKARGRRA